MNSQASTPATCLREAASARQASTAADTPPRPLYQLVYLIAMLEREAEAEKARQQYRQQEQRR
jgi:hypothetical protein